MIKLNSWLISAWNANVSASAIAPLHNTRKKNNTLERKKTEENSFAFAFAFACAERDFDKAKGDLRRENLCVFIQSEWSPKLTREKGKSQVLECSIKRCRFLFGFGWAFKRERRFYRFFVMMVRKNCDSRMFVQLSGSRMFFLIA